MTAVASQSHTWCPCHITQELTLSSMTMHVLFSEYAMRLGRCSADAVTVRSLACPLNRSTINQISLTGVTFVVSSGDHGVAYGSQEQCLSSDGSLLSDSTNGTFLGQFPASCPYVTAVGATQLPKNQTVSFRPHCRDHSIFLTDSRFTMPNTQRLRSTQEAGSRTSSASRTTSTAPSRST